MSGSAAGDGGAGEETTGNRETLVRPGTVLERARREAGLSQQQVAASLNLGVDTIAALEDDDYLQLGAPVFIRGHIRRYAESLRVDPEPLLQAYAGIADVTEPRVVVPERAGETVTAPVNRAGGLAMVALVAAALTISWFLTRPTAEGPADAPGEAGDPVAAATLPEESTQQPVLVTDEGIVADADEPEGVNVENGVEEEHEATQGDAAAGVPDAAAALDQDQGSISSDDPAPVSVARTPVVDGPRVPLSLRFSEASWVEVTDATGQRLIYDLADVDQEVLVEGIAPLSVFLGNGEVVELSSGAFRIDHAPFIRSNQTARFVVDVDGVVRRR